MTDEKITEETLRRVAEELMKRSSIQFTFNVPFFCETSHYGARMVVKRSADEVVADYIREKLKK